MTAREVLDRGAEKIERELLDQPTVRANLLDAMGRVYTGLGLYGQATDLLYSSLQASEDSPDNPAAREVRTLTALAAALYLRGDYGRSEEMARDAVSSLAGAGRPLIVS